MQPLPGWQAVVCTAGGVEQRMRQVRLSLLAIIQATPYIAHTQSSSGMLKALLRVGRSKSLISHQHFRSDVICREPTVIQFLSGRVISGSPATADTAVEVGLAVPQYAKSWLVSQPVPQDTVLPPPTGVWVRPKPWFFTFTSQLAKDLATGCAPQHSSQLNRIDLLSNWC